MKFAHVLNRLPSFSLKIATARLVSEGPHQLCVAVDGKVVFIDAIRVKEETATPPPTTAPEPRFVTAKTFPLDQETGKFQSGPAEAAFTAAMGLGIGRSAVRNIIQAYQLAQDEADRQYEEWKKERESPALEPRLVACVAALREYMDGDNWSAGGHWVGDERGYTLAEATLSGVGDLLTEEERWDVEQARAVFPAGSTLLAIIDRLAPRPAEEKPT